MFFKISWDEDFDTLMMHLWSKYGKELFTIDGIGEQMDLHKFAKKFFSGSGVTADVSVDANANVVAKTGIEYNFEMSKPLKRYNSYFLLWKEIKKMYGLEVANETIEAQMTGDIYINDFSSVSEPYCFNYSTCDIACNGLQGLSSRLKIEPPKSLATFFRQVEQFIAIAANSTLGATGLADLLIVASKFVDKIIASGMDGHVKIDNLEIYAREQITSLIYTLNWSFRANQSPFSNVSLYDNTFLESLCPDYRAKPTTVKLLQKIYCEVMNAEMRRTPLTFPVTTACFAIDENREIKDKAFLRFIAAQNKEYGFINLYNGSVATLSSCCRLRSNRDNLYFNSFVAGSTKIGSLGVVTANLPRAALKANGGPEKFIENVRTLFGMAMRINAAKRRIIEKRIQIGAAPLYTHGYMELSKQYSTFGVVGINEAVELLGEDILAETGQALVTGLLKTIGGMCDAAEKYLGAPHNCEQVPAESSAIKLAQKDKYIGYGIDKPLYSNQFIPLTTKADMYDRLRLQGKFDCLLSGGAIAHINIGERISDSRTMERLMEFAAKQGVVYWAVNYRLYCCESRHTWVGGEICPVCGKSWEDEITRVVGFFTTVKNWHKARREQDWPNRQFYCQPDQAGNEKGSLETRNG